jgi:hypothetical protein
MKTQTKKRKLMLLKTTIIKLSEHTVISAHGGKTSTIPLCVPESTLPSCRVARP